MAEPTLFPDESLHAQQDTKPSAAAARGGPLAERMRPQRLEEFRGQEALVGPNSPLRRSIEEDRVHSFILWGPPGTGKTTLARIVAQHTEREFISLSAVMSGVKDIKESVARAKELLRISGRRTILFVDEIHRFNKSQQDALLPYVEDGTVTLIGATTENPSFELNSALLSRAPVFVLKQLASEELQAIVERALSDPTYGLGALGVTLPPDWLAEIVKLANGDARRALTLLERVTDYVHSLKGKAVLDGDQGREVLERALGSRTLRYDSSGEEHYNTISAFIKSLRDSDPDAALYYLARMLESGEDPLFVVRRMVIFASEDISNADPRALQVALNVRDAVDFVGMPEARISLAQAVTYLACAPKSNASYLGIEEALSDVREHGNLEVPLHIRNASTRLMKNLGYGASYKYAHDFPDAVTGQTNLPAELKDRRYYQPKESGLEKQIRERLAYLRGKRK
ncbi:MAG: replication-associated recombination protein A [Deltaproteobacteria bacterium]|nr:replication-associated recombination protein A [Deltaproteobacteria bacterium]